MAFLDVFKILLLPALIAGGIYALLAYVVIPLYRNHYARYRQYLPLESISQHTSSFGTRAANALGRLILPSNMQMIRTADGPDAGSGDELYFGEEEGENMVGFDVHSRDRAVRDGRVGGDLIDSERRLSRDLEEGFKDDSEDEDEGDDRRRRS